MGKKDRQTDKTDSWEKETSPSLVSPYDGSERIYLISVDDDDAEAHKKKKNIKRGKRNEVGQGEKGKKKKRRIIGTCRPIPTDSLCFSM